MSSALEKVFLKQCLELPLVGVIPPALPQTEPDPLVIHLIKDASEEDLRALSTKVGDLKYLARRYADRMSQIEQSIIAVYKKREGLKS